MTKAFFALAKPAAVFKYVRVGISQTSISRLRLKHSNKSFNILPMRVCLILIIFLFTTASGFSQKVELLTVDGLNERLKQGKDTTYVLNFWATWCAPCIKELPHFEKLQQEKRREKLKVLLISLDFSLEKDVLPFVKKRGLKNEVYLIREPDQQVYIDRIDKSWSGAIPATLFVKGKKRKFVEKEYTYPALLTEYQKFK